MAKALLFSEELVVKAGELVLQCDKMAKYLVAEHNLLTSSKVGRTKLCSKKGERQ